MKQSRVTSLVKSIVSTAIGFVVAMAANALVLPLFGFHPSLGENLQITTIYTAISIVRGFGIDRLFESFGWRTRMSSFALAVLSERQRQIDVEGRTAQDDDEQEFGMLAAAGACYALESSRHAHGDRGVPRRDDCDMPACWPWTLEWWKPHGVRRDLVRAAALIIAEGDRFDRRRPRGAR